MYKIPFNRASYVGNEQIYISQAIANGHISGDGYFSKKSQSFLENLLGVGKVLLTTSCTHALEMAALLLDFHEGDEVIVPSFTFVSTINAFVLRGARPVFADIRFDTLNIDESQIESLISPNTKAILPVHYAGVGCEMEAIMKIAEERGLDVVEDNAHGLFGKYRGRYLGTFGCMATQSFHETKNITCGEGGALLINDPKYVERAEIIREKGTNRSSFFRGQVDKYTWIDFGSSYLPSDILAAFLFAQLEKWESIQSKRKRIWEIYYEQLKELEEKGCLQLPKVPSHCDQPYHMFYILLPSLGLRQSLIEFMKSRGILSVFHYLPLHLSAMGRKFGGESGMCPVAETISDRLLRLPFYYELTEKDQSLIVNTIKEFLL